MGGVYPGGVYLGGVCLVCPGEGVCPGGCLLVGGVCQGGVCPGGVVCLVCPEGVCTCEQNSLHMLLKTLPFHNFVCGRLISMSKEVLPTSPTYAIKHMSHFSYACKMRYLLNLVLESWEYLWSYLTFWVLILDYV